MLQELYCDDTISTHPSSRLTSCHVQMAPVGLDVIAAHAHSHDMHVMQAWLTYHWFSQIIDLQLSHKRLSIVLIKCTVIC